jgi:hypothetical protein
MFFGNNQKMHWGGRMNVIKSEDFFVLINLLARDFLGNNLAKNAIWVITGMFHRRGSYLKSGLKTAI